MTSPDAATAENSTPALERRLGRRHARLRLGIEHDHETRIFGQGLNFFHIENWYSIHGVIRAGLMATGLYWRGRRNAANVVLRRNEIRFATLPAAFDGFAILHVSDLHIDMNAGAMRRVAALVAGLQYDITVLTGDFRGKTYGDIAPTVAGLARLKGVLAGPVYGVLGNHDTIRMVPELEAMGIRMLLNECDIIARGGDRIFLAGIDDAHYFRVDNIEKAADAIPDGDFSILLSHTPEIYRQAAHADFDLLLAGHTHGGQICLPGGMPLTLDSHLPRRLGAGAWRHHRMVGYTSVGAGASIVPVRFNCPPEITLHILRRG